MRDGIRKRVVERRIARLDHRAQLAVAHRHDGIAVGRRPGRRLARRIRIRAVSKPFFVHAYRAGEGRSFRLADVHRHRDLVGITVSIRHHEVQRLIGRDIGIGRKHIAARRGIEHQRAVLQIKAQLAVFRSRALLAVHRQALLAAFIVRAVVDVHAARHFRAGRHVLAQAVGTDGRHVVHHVHRDGAVDLGAIHIHHRHGQVMGDIVHAGAAMLRGVAAQFVGKLQLARDRIEARYRQRAFIRGHGIAREPALFKHHNTADHDGGHAIGGRDDQGAAGRSGRTILSSLGAIRQAGFVHRHRIRTGSRIGRFDDDAVILAVDGDGHLAFGDIAVRVRIGVGELFRQRFAVRQFLHRRVVVVQPVAVSTVGIQGDRTKMPVLVRIPGKIRTVRAGYRTRERVTDDGDGVPFRHFMREAPDGRYVVHHVHRDGRTVAVAVRIRHRHGQVMGNLRVRSRIAFVVFRGVPVERIAEIQLARDRVIARHGQGAFICGHNVAGQLAVFVNHHVVDDDGGHAVGGVDVQGAAGRSGRSGLTRLRTARQAAFIHRQIDRTRFRAGSDGHIVVDIDFRSAGLHGIRSKLRAAVETDIQTPQMIDAVQQIAAAVLVIAAAARGTAGGRAGGGHQVFAKGREEILPADLHTFHLEGRHLFLGIGGVEALQLDGRAILKSQDKIVAIAGQRRRIRGKVEDEASVRSAGDGLCGTSGRLGKTDIGHEGPPKKK